MVYVDREIDIQGEEVQTTDGAGKTASNTTDLHTLCNVGIVPLELMPLDMKEKNEIEKFVTNTCGCKMNNGGPCSDKFADKFYTVRAQCADLDKESLDLVLLGQIMALMNTSEEITSRRRPSVTRQRYSYIYYHEGVKVLSNINISDSYPI